jgi:NADPH:quinone reductase-like Zn-dependent oxidoreductase
MNTSKQLFNHISSNGGLTLSLVEVDVPSPKAHEIVVKMEASPINPSDMWPMFGPTNLSDQGDQGVDQGVRVPDLRNLF